jgi:glycosyltransferase involved in cell wall biosynthesis
VSARPRVLLEALAVRDRPTGVAGAAVDLVTALAARDRGFDFVVVAAAAAPFAALADRPGWRVLVPPGVDSGAGRALFLQRGLPALCRREGAAMLHTLQPVAPARPACPLLVTVHDVAWRDLPDAVPWRRRLYYDLAIPAGLRRAALVLASSEATAGLLRRHFPALAGRVRVTPLGTPAWVWETAPAAGPPPARPFFLFVGRLEPRKNLPRLLDAYGDLVAAMGDRAPDLRLVGPEGWGLAPLRERLARPDLHGRVSVQGWCERPALRGLYASARALVFPSLQEGFGLPVIEAMACGLPVLTSAGGALGEVAGDAALLADPRDRAALAAALGRLAGDDALCERLRRGGPGRARRWTWERTADLTTAAYEHVASAPGPRK